MKKRKYSKLKRNPLVLFIRQILRFFSRLFKQKKRISRSSHSHKSLIDEYRYIEPLTSITKLDSCAKKDGLMTVGELLEQVKWQTPEEISPEKNSDLGMVSQAHDVSLN